jgi:hypothetical protein
MSGNTIVMDRSLVEQEARGHPAQLETGKWKMGMENAKTWGRRSRVRRSQILACLIRSMANGESRDPDVAGREASKAPRRLYSRSVAYIISNADRTVHSKASNCTGTDVRRRSPY